MSASIRQYRTSIRPITRAVLAVVAFCAVQAMPGAQESPMRVIIAPQPQPRSEPRPARPQPAQPARRPAPSVAPPQATTPTPSEEAKREEARRLGPPPIYERQLVELSEAMGSLAFLTGLCSPAVEPNAWQKRMDGLIESEGVVTTTREKMIGAYNQGFVAFQTSHRQCSDAARAARALLVRDAARVARELERRYGG